MSNNTWNKENPVHIGVLEYKIVNDRCKQLHLNELICKRQR